MITGVSVLVGGLSFLMAADVPQTAVAPDRRLPELCRMYPNDQNVQGGCALMEGKLAEADRAREEEACRRKGAVRCWWSSLWGD